MANERDRIAEIAPRLGDLLVGGCDREALIPMLYAFGLAIKTDALKAVRGALEQEKGGEA